MNEIATQNGQPDFHKPKSLESFAERLNDQPLKAEIQINKAANNSKYLPISFVQMQLDEIYLGLWETVNFQWAVIANEIVGKIELRVFHPVAKVWLTRTGAAAAMIQQKSGSAITDIGAKGKNTLVKDFPHLEAECLKNAAKKLGKRFGRDLNRILEDAYNSFLDEVTTAKAAQDDGLADKLANCRNPGELKILLDSNPEWEQNPAILKQFSERLKELQNGSR